MSGEYPKLKIKWTKGDDTASITLESAPGAKKTYVLSETHVGRFATAFVNLALQMEQSKPATGNYDPSGISQQSVFPAHQYAAGVNPTNGKGWVSFRTAMAWMGFEMDKGQLLELAQKLPQALSISVPDQEKPH